MPWIAVAQPDHVHARALGRGQGEYRHRVRVVHDHGPGTMALRVAQDVQPDRSGTKGLEDAAWSDGVADALVYAVLQRYLVIVAHVLEPGDLDGVDEEVRPRQNVVPLGRRFDVPVLARGLDQSLGYPVRQLEPLGVDVHEGEGATVQALHCQHVRDDLAGKDRATRADERYFGHLSSPPNPGQRPEKRHRRAPVPRGQPPPRRPVLPSPTPSRRVCPSP